VDAAEAAIARAMAARASEATMTPEEKARTDLEKLQQRLQKTRDKLAHSLKIDEDPKIIEALESTVERLASKVDAAQQQLSALVDS
jgi:electron transport complex protein RnfC